MYKTIDIIKDIILNDIDCLNTFVYNYNDIYGVRGSILADSDFFKQAEKLFLESTDIITKSIYLIKYRGSELSNFGNDVIDDVIKFLVEDNSGKYYWKDFIEGITRPLNNNQIEKLKTTEEYFGSNLYEIYRKKFNI